MGDGKYLVVIWRASHATPKRMVTRDVATLKIARAWLEYAGKRGLRGKIVRGHEGKNPRVVGNI